MSRFLGGLAALLILIGTASGASAFADFRAKIGVSGPGAMDYVLVGQRAGAADGFDNAFDTAAIGGNLNDTSIATWLSHPEWGQAIVDFRGDVRSPKERDEWTVSVATNLPAGTALTLGLLPGSTVPTRYTLTVEDLDTGAITDLLAGSYPFPVPAANAVKTFKVTSTALAPIAPGAPLIGTATAGNARAIVNFSPPASDGGSAIQTYFVLSGAGVVVAKGLKSPIVVPWLLNGTRYAFTVVAKNAVGTGPASAVSNSVTPRP